MKKYLFILFIIEIIYPVSADLCNESKNFSMSTPYIEGNLIKSQFFNNNTSSVQLWNYPYFVWGLYNYNGSIIKTVCPYQSDNIFACNLVTGNYIFNMSYSSYLKYSQCNESYYTSNIYINNDTVNLNPYAQRLNQDTREITLQFNFFNYLWLIFVIIIVIGLLSIGKKDDDYDKR